MHALGARVYKASRLNFFAILTGFLCQTAFLYLRGQTVGRCPLTSLFEVLIFLSWSTVLFYLLIGPAYRLSLLGAFTSPLAFLFQVGALLLVHGYEPIEEAVVSAFAGRIDYALTSFVDHKTELQEALAREGRSVKYEIVETEGPPHDRRFTCAARVDGEQLGIGSGPSKKAAEQEAAKQALAALGLEPQPVG